MPPRTGDEKTSVPSAVPPASPLPFLVGDAGGSRGLADNRFCPRGVHALALAVGDSVATGEVASRSFEGVVGRVDRCVGVVGRIVDEGEDAAGDSGRRKGEVRGELNERGEGLYVEGRDW